jgi:hypothetical protein
MFHYLSVKPYKVKPVLRGYLLDKEKVDFEHRWSLKRGSIDMKFSMTGQKKETF